MSERARFGIAPHPIELQEACDRAALAHLGAAYCHGIDRRDFALLRTLYHDDAIDNHAPYFTGPASEYIEWLPKMMATWRMTAHRIVTALYLINGDAAEGELAATAYHETLDGTRAFIAHGRYVDRYARREDIWRFAYRSFVLDWTEDRPIIHADDFGSKGVGVGKAGANDPVYTRLPMFGADRAARE